MSRVQLALNVDNLEEAVTFYSKLFNTAAGETEAGLRELRHRAATTQAGADREPRRGRHHQPPRRRGRIERPGARGDRTAPGEGLFTDEEIGTTCCFATQDKVWVTGPAGEKWEVYTVLADSDTFGSSPRHLDPDAEGCHLLRWATPEGAEGRRGHFLLLTAHGRDRRARGGVPPPAPPIACVHLPFACDLIR